MKNGNQFDDAISAYENIKILKQTLKSENEAIDVEIAEAKRELDWLLTSYLPLEDLKDGIMKILFLGAENYEMGAIRPALAGLATNTAWQGMAGEHGYPLKYQTIENVFSGKLGDYPACQIFTPNKSQSDDRVFLALLFKTIEPTIRSIMEKMTPEEFGYARIMPSEIGPGLKERREMIQVIKAKIQELELKKGANVQKLHALSE
ncbi:hypothetical protein [Nitrosomonas sp.]|uniref:hypothetical protein n=1 Tax=Nitrosomonas sp. TaxID=42353 RepID=UPI001D7E6209|nr:hypothetical protein [Nitrosomonas sp.]MBX3617481.1 hypothetical protein [Nitrosomonas sp.]